MPQRASFLPETTWLDATNAINANEHTAKSMKPIDILPLITVWWQVRVRANHLRYQQLITFTVVRGFAPGSRNSSQLLP